MNSRRSQKQGTFLNNLKNVLYPNEQQQQPSSKHAKQGVMVLDFQNVAMSYGQHLAFKCEGITKAIKWCEDQGYRVKGFMPEDRCNEDIVKERRKNNARPSQTPDDVDYLNELVEEGILETIPSGHYDDVYAIEYAKEAQKQGEQAFIVSNDLFRDRIEGLEDDKNYRWRVIDKEKRWLKKTSRSFKFNDKRKFELVQHN